MSRYRVPAGISNNPPAPLDSYTRIDRGTCRYLLFRAVAEQETAGDAEASWHGRWHEAAELAVAQAKGWAEDARILSVWVEASDGRAWEIPCV